MGKSIHDLREMLCEELESITEHGSLSGEKLKMVDMLTHSIKSIDTIVAMEEAGYSNDSYAYRSNNDSYRNGGRRYSRDDRYNRDDRYSRDEGLMHKFEQMLNETSSEKEREMIKRFMEQMR